MDCYEKREPWKGPIYVCTLGKEMGDKCMDCKHRVPEITVKAMHLLSSPPGPKDAA